MTAPARTRRLVVVGASLAGLRVVEGARDAGFDGELTLIGDEPVAPYDRTVLSTRFLEDREEPQTPVYRPADDLRRDLDVDLRLGVAAHTLDPRSRTVHAGGHTIPYDALVIATGVRPRTPGWAANLAGVHLLRTVADARALRKSLARSRRVVVVGGGFIGSEVASSARTLGLHVTIVEARDVPFAAALGETAGRLCAALHRAHGTELRCGVTVTALDGTGRVEKVLLSDGSVLKADTVVVGVGSHPNTEWLKGSGVACTDGVECDAALRTTVPGVYAVGDVARWFNPWLGRKVR
ncbi:NAD(P)/FAD-dependent oxidoreductase, partial [Thermobifida fusca]